MPAFSTVERAFQIAQSGKCQSLEDLRTVLAREGYMDGVAQTSFPHVRKQLRELMQGRTLAPEPKAAQRRKSGVLRLNYARP